MAKSWPLFSPSEYNKIGEDLEDIKLYDAAKKGKQEFIDAEQALQEIEEVAPKQGTQRAYNAQKYSFFSFN